MQTATKKGIAILTLAAVSILSFLNIWLALTTGAVMLAVAYLLTHNIKKTNFSKLSQPAKDWIDSLPNAEDFKLRFDGLNSESEISWVKNMIDLRLITQH